MKNQIIPIFFSCDDNYMPFLSVALQSLEESSDKNNFQYNIYVLNNGEISNKNIQTIKSNYSRDCFNVEFVDISNLINPIATQLHTRDYYTKTTYFRLFIPNLYPQYDKALYLDADIAVIKDISKLYLTDIGNNYVGGTVDGVVASRQEFRDYAKNTIGLQKGYEQYFNAGILIMNLKKLREINFQQKFLTILSKVTFDVAQDQDYLNAICNNNVKIVERGWNAMPVPGTELPKEKLYLIHYNLSFKPWHIDNVMYEQYFWEYAKKAPYYDQIKCIKDNYDTSLQSQSQKETINLINTANFEANDTKTNEIIHQKIKEVMNS